MGGREEKEVKEEGSWLHAIGQWWQRRWRSQLIGWESVCPSVQQAERLAEESCQSSLGRGRGRGGGGEGGEGGERRAEGGGRWRRRRPGSATYAAHTH